MSGNTCNCINGEVRLIDTFMAGSISLASAGIIGYADVVNTSVKGSIEITMTEIAGAANIIDTTIMGAVALICAVNMEAVIRFSLELLKWQADEVGVVKYNQLVASDDWQLSEIQIEELL